MKVAEPCTYRWFAFAVLWACAVPLVTVAEPEISCSADRPVAEIGSAVTLRVFVAPTAARNLQVSWRVSAGTIEGKNTEVVWKLQAVPSGFQKATAMVRSAQGKLPDCSLEIVATEPERGGQPTKRESTRFFLDKAKKEEAGFGLYSYILLGGPPTDSSRGRYLRAIDAYIALLLPLEDLQDSVDHRKLNVTYLPVRAAVPPQVTSQWLLDNYDFARARVLLDLLPGDHREGPYIVSSATPLSRSGALNSRYLYQNLSTVPVDPKDLVSWWVREFENQAAQERFWSPSVAENFALRMRTTISVLATGLPEVQKQVSTWVAWVK